MTLRTPFFAQSIIYSTTIDTEFVSSLLLLKRIYVVYVNATVLNSAEFRIGCGLIHTNVLGSKLLHEGVYDILKGVSSLHKIISVTA